MKNVFYFILFLFLFIQCSQKSYQHEIIELDAQKTGLTVQISGFSVATLNIVYYAGSFRIGVLGKASDLRGIEKVEVKGDYGIYQPAVSSNGFEDWRADVDLNSYLSSHTVCARVTNKIGAQRETCSLPNEYIIQKASYRATDSGYAETGVRWNGCVYYKESNGKDTLYCLGGEDDSPYSYAETELSIYYIQSNVWIFENQYVHASDVLHFEMPESRKAFGISLLGSKIYLMGGMNGRDISELQSDPTLSASASDYRNYYNNELAYNISGSSWSQTIAPMPTRRIFNSAVALNGKIYVMGGRYPPGINMSLKTVEIYDPASNTWSTAASMNKAREQFLAVTDGTYIYVVGGLDYQQGKALNSIEYYNPSSNTWQELPPMNYARWASWGGILRNKFIYVMGGEDFNGRYSHIERFNTQTQTWETFNDNGFICSQGAYAVFNDTIFSVGGMNGAGQRTYYVNQYFANVQ